MCPRSLPRPLQPPVSPRAHLEQPGVQQQGVGSLRVVLVADVQVLQLVQVPGVRDGVQGTTAGAGQGGGSTGPRDPPREAGLSRAMLT